MIQAGPHRPPVDSTVIPASRRELLQDLAVSGVRSTAVLDAMAEVPRNRFVRSDLIEHAWENTALPIDCQQTISQPLVVALMTERLDLDGGMRVLEIGTGSGYQTAVLARLANHVWSIERHHTLFAEARDRFAELNIENITCRSGDGCVGWPEEAPFDRIMVTAAATTMPQSLIDQLTPGGIMVVPVGGTPFDQKLYHVRRLESGHEDHAFLDVRFVPLVHG